MWYEDILENTWGEKYWILDRTYKPVSTPYGRGVQGSLKVDWVTLWFLIWNLNSTWSPGAAS